MNNADGVFSVALIQDIIDENQNILGILFNRRINQKVVKVIKEIEVDSNPCNNDSRKIGKISLLGLDFHVQ